MAVLLCLGAAGAVITLGCQGPDAGALTQPGTVSGADLRLGADTRVTGTARATVDQYGPDGSVVSRHAVKAWDLSAPMRAGSAVDNANGSVSGRPTLIVAEGLNGNNHDYGSHVFSVLGRDGRMQREVRMAEGNGPTSSQLFYDGDQLVAGVSSSWSRVSGGWLLDSMSITVYRNGRPNTRVHVIVDSVATQGPGLAERVTRPIVDALASWVLPTPAYAETAPATALVARSADSGWCIVELMEAIGAVLLVPEGCAIPVSPTCAGAVLLAIGAIYNYDKCAGLIQPT